MSLTVYHNYVSPILDAGNPDLVGPDEWNAAHTIQLVGTDKEVLFNDAGAFGGSSHLLYDKVGTTLYPEDDGELFFGFGPVNNIGYMTIYDIQLQDGQDYSAILIGNFDSVLGREDFDGSNILIAGQAGTRIGHGNRNSYTTDMFIHNNGEITVSPEFGGDFFVGTDNLFDAHSIFTVTGTPDYYGYTQITHSNDTFTMGLQFLKSRGTAMGSHTIVHNNDILGEIDFGGADGSDWVWAGAITCEVDGAPSAGHVPGRFVFGTSSGSSVVDRLSIDSTGAIIINAGGKLKFTGATSGVVTIQTLGAAGTYTLTLPNNDGNNGDILTTDGTGGLSWTAAGAAAIAIGSAITGGNATRVLFEGVGPVLADSANFTYNSTTSSLVLTSSATTAFAVGRTGATNPAFMIDSSTTSSVTGIKVTAHTAAGGVVLEPTSSTSDENLFIEAKGGGGIFLVGNIGSFVASGQDFVPTVTDTKALGRTGARWTSLFLSPTATVDFNSGNVTITHSTGALSITGASGASVSVTKNLAANTSGDGLSLINSTAATSGSQMYSPRLRLTGTGWKTLATAASQTVDWIVENTPVQGTTNPLPTLSFKAQANSLGYVELLNLQRTIDNSGSIMTFTSPDGGGCRLELSVTTNNPLARFYTDGGVGVTFGSLNGNGISFLVNSTNAVAVTNVSGAKQLFVDATGSTIATPAMLGVNNFAANRAARWIFGDSANGVQNAFDNRMQIYAYHGIEIGGARADITPPSFVPGAAGADPSLTVFGPVVITASTSSSAQLSVGRTGQTNPVFNVDTSTTNAVTGVNIKGAAATARVAMSVTSSTTDEGFSIDAKGAGTIRLGATSTGAVEFSRNAVPTANDGSALGTTALQWSDLFLATGGVINFNNGNLTLTHSATNLTVAGGSLTLAAGTATAAPLVFTAGSNLTTAADGAMEFDGQMLYFSPDGTDRRIVATSAYIRQHAAYVLANSTTNQKLFNSSTNGQVLLPTGTYRFNCMFSLSGMSATSGNAAFSVAAGSGATVTNGMMLWTAIDATTTPTAGAAFQSGMVRSVTGPTNLATASTLTEMQAYITGTFEVSVAGQVIPSIALVTGITATNNIGGFFECWKLGATTDTNIGKWS